MIEPVALCIVCLGVEVPNEDFGQFDIEGATCFDCIRAMEEDE